MTTKPNTQAIREKLDKELGSYKIDGKEFREMWGLFDLVVVFLDEQLKKKEEEVIERMRNMSASQRRYLLFPEKFKVQARTPHRRLIQRHSKHRTHGRYRDDCELCQKEFLKS